MDNDFLDCMITRNVTYTTTKHSESSSLRNGDASICQQRRNSRLIHALGKSCVQFFGTTERLSFQISWIGILNQFCLLYRDTETKIARVRPERRKGNSFFCMTLPVTTSGQNSWLHIQRIRVWFPALTVFWEVVGLEQGSLSLVSTIEELLIRNSSGSGLENQEYSRRNPSHWPRSTLCPQESWH
jgi:hypothetical protein